MLKTSNHTIRKYIFFSAIIAMIAGIIFASAKTVLTIHFQYQVAASTAKDIGIYIQKIAGVSKQLQLAKNIDTYNQYQKNMISLVRELELSHLGLAQGNPAFGEETEFAVEIQNIYHAMSGKLQPVDQTIASAKELAAIPFKKLTADNPVYLRIQLENKGQIVSTISNLIQDYKQLAEDEISRTVFLSFICVFLVFLAFIFGYGFFFRTAGNEESNTTTPDHTSVANILGGLTVFPGKSEEGIELIREGSMASHS